MNRRYLGEEREEKRRKNGETTRKVRKGVSAKK